MPQLYEYMKGFCVCQGEEVYLVMKSLVGADILSYPVTVYDVNETALSSAADKSQFITIWNGSAANATVGKLTGAAGPFTFLLKLKPGQSAPDWVIGDVAGGGGDTFLIIDSNGDLLVDSNGDALLYQ